MNLIDGEWIDGNGEAFESLDPATNVSNWRGHAASASEVDRAIRSAGDARAGWEALGNEGRADILGRFADLLSGPKGEELAQAISGDAGKPIWEARTEVASVKGKFAASIEGSERNREVIRDAGPARSITRFVPIGVVGVVGPFNFPAHMANGHLIPALLAGNAVILKPSPLAPRSAEVHVSALVEAGVPAGVISLVHGGAEPVNQLIDAGVDGICFTGSREAGEAIHRRLAGRPEVLLTLEMGGNSPLVVWSYDDLDAAVIVAIQSAFITAGQRCNCARRLVVNTAIADEFLTRLVEVSQQLVIGAPNDEPAPFMGPLITEPARARFLRGYKDLLASGGTAVLVPEPRRSQGNFVTPGIVEMSNAARFVDREIFGPLIQVRTADSLGKAIADANDTRFGLAAGLISRSREDFDEFSRCVNAGLLNWNQQLTGASGVAPFGGVKLSGNHRPAGILSADYVADGVAITEVTELGVPSTLPPGIIL